MYDYAFLPIRRYIISPTIGRRPTTSNQIILLTKGMLDPKIWTSAQMKIIICIIQSIHPYCIIVNLLN